MIFTMLGVFVVLPSFTLSRSYYIVMVYLRLYCSDVLLLWYAVLTMRRTALSIPSPRYFLHALRPQGPPGRLDVFSQPRSSTWTYSLFVFLPFHCSRVCRSRVAPLCFPFKFSSGVVRRSTCVVRLVSVSQLSWSGQVGRLPSCVQVIGLSQTRGLVVLDVSDSVEFHPRVTQCMP